MPPEITKIATIVGAHGVRGEVKLRLFIRNIELLTQSPLLDASGHEVFALKITGKTKEGVIAKPSTTNDRNAAELLKGKELYIRTSLLPAIKEGEFYHSQLIGLEVRLAHGELYGTIDAIHNFGAGDIIDITTTSGASEMLPFKAPWLEAIHFKDGYIVISPAEYIEMEK